MCKIGWAIIVIAHHDVRWDGIVLADFIKLRVGFNLSLVGYIARINAQVSPQLF
jgi:hypothetical protein